MRKAFLSLLVLSLMLGPPALVAYPKADAPAAKNLPLPLVAPPPGTLGFTSYVNQRFSKLEGQIVALADTKADKKTDPNPPVVPTVTLPATKTAKANRYFCLKPGGNVSSVKWIIPPGLDQIDPEIPLKDTMAIVLIGDSGVYVVQCYGALGDVASDIASCTVTIGDPVPPTPPTPPTPPDPLTAALQAGYNLDTDSDKAISLGFLQAAYAGLAKTAPSLTNINTVADAVSVQTTVIQAPSGLTLQQVVNLRKAIMADFTATFGTVGTKAIALADLGTWLAKVSSALSSVK